MEPHKKLSSEYLKYKPNFQDGPNEYFKKAKEFVDRFYKNEYNKIANIRFEDTKSDDFFNEYVWVVHATGFSAKSVGHFYDKLIGCYGSWLDLSSLSVEDAVNKVKVICNNPLKIKSVWQTSNLIKKNVESLGWEKWKNDCLSSPELLQELPHIGPTTCFHLARNIGILDSVKPDLHLVRMANHWGFASCYDMCKSLQSNNMPLGLVDLILWYSASTFGTIDIKKENER